MFQGRPVLRSATILMVMGLLGAAGCASADDKSFALTVASGVGQAALRADDGVFQLNQQEVASGMEFSDGTYTFRGQGQEAFVEKDGERIYTDCVAAGHPENPES